MGVKLHIRSDVEKFVGVFQIFQIFKIIKLGAVREMDVCFRSIVGRYSLSVLATSWRHLEKLGDLDLVMYFWLCYKVTFIFHQSLNRSVSRWAPPPLVLQHQLGINEVKVAT